MRVKEFIMFQFLKQFFTKRAESRRLAPRRMSWRHENCADQVAPVARQESLITLCPWSVDRDGEVPEQNG
jgi:hypothetical protein